MQLPILSTVKRDKSETICGLSLGKETFTTKGLNVVWTNEQGMLEMIVFVHFFLFVPSWFWRQLDSLTGIKLNATFSSSIQPVEAH